MHTYTRQLVITLPRRELITLEVVPPTRLVCVDGALWITLQDQSIDIVLQAGEVVDLGPRGTAAVQALRSARFAVWRYAGWRSGVGCDTSRRGRTAARSGRRRGRALARRSVRRGSR